MENLHKKDAELLIKLSVEELDPAQIRLIKMINSLVNQVLTAEDEAEYFELSAALIKKSAEIIKASHYAKNNKKLPVARQALEFAFDFFSENLIEDDLGNIDN
jgi:hypothetical protein